jgi:hypothetical protein
MKILPLKASPNTQLHRFSVAILCLALLCLAALPVMAVTYSDLPKALQGTYKVKSVKVVVNGKAQPSPKPKTTPFVVGAHGFEAVSAATISKMILAGGGGSQAKIKVTYAYPTAMTGTVSGKLGSEGDITIKSGTMNGKISSTGLVINLAVTGTSSHGATKMTVGITLKK